MLLRSQRSLRRGATLVETAVAISVLLSLTLGAVIIGMGVYRYQQVAALAREGARYASVHGGKWAAAWNSGTLTTASDVRANAIVPRAAGLNTGTSILTCSVSYADSGQMPTYTSGSSTKTNIVTVTVNYQWAPEGYLGTMTLSSTSSMPISY
jgi:Flp pilus assembly protein TadG